MHVLSFVYCAAKVYSRNNDNINRYFLSAIISTTEEMY